MNGWIAVDLDGTLARYDGFKGVDVIGEPIKPMVDRVKNWLAQGQDVRIFTARVDGGTAAINLGNPDGEVFANVERVKTPIREWCKKHIGQELPITNVKDYGMIELWDDRAIQVVPNTGESELDQLKSQLAEQTNTITALCLAIDPECKHGPETAKIVAYAEQTRKLALDLATATGNENYKVNKAREIRGHLDFSPFPPGKENQQRRMEDWSLLNNQVVGGEVFPMAHWEQIKLLKEQLAECQRQRDALAALVHDEFAGVEECHVKGVHEAAVKALAAHDAALVAPTIELLEHINNWFPCCAQLLDGWHNDGTAWSDWDEAVRNKLTEIQVKLAPELARLRAIGK